MLLGGALRTHAKAPTREANGAPKAQRAPRVREIEGGMYVCLCICVYRHLEVDVDVGVHVDQMLSNAAGRGSQNTCTSTN